MKESTGCTKCHKKEKLHFFSALHHGMLCVECGRNVGAVSVLESTLYTMQYIVATPLEKLYTFTVSEAVLQQLKKCMKRFLKIHIEHEMKALELLEDNNNL